MPQRQAEGNRKRNVGIASVHHVGIVSVRAGWQATPVSWRPRGEIRGGAGSNETWRDRSALDILFRDLWRSGVPGVNPVSAMSA